MVKKIRTRFAPSPTGFVHVGSLLTVIYDWLIARQNNGDFILRIEDTDQSREVAGATENILKVLQWAGLEPDEGVVLDKSGKTTEKGQLGPYIQSNRLELYKKYAQQLVNQGAAYYCFCSKERLDQVRTEQEKNKQLTKYDGYCRNLDQEEVAAKLKSGSPYVIRQKIPKSGQTILHDLIRGEISFPHDSIDDSVLLKSDGFPTYHLAVVVDDHLMQITHVIRGQEWLPSAPKHILLYQAFDWEMPAFAHMSHLLNKDKTKLSKRQGDVAVEDYIRKGYLPEALINFLVTTGWNEGQGCEQEVYSLDELVKKFSLEKVHKTGAVFDLDKLNWLNAHYLRQLPAKRFVELALPYLAEAGYNLSDKKFVQKVVALEQERIKNLSELPALVSYFFTADLDYDAKKLVWKKSDAVTTKNNLAKLLEFLPTIKKWTKDNLEKEIMKWIGESGLATGEVLWPMRFALTGQDKSPGPFEVAEVLGREKTIARINSASSKL